MNGYGEFAAELQAVSDEGFALVFGLDGDALFHDEGGEAELLIYALADGHAAGHAGGGGRFRVEERPGGGKSGFLFEEAEEALGEGGEFAVAAVFGWAFEVFGGFGVVEAEEEIDGVAGRDPGANGGTLGGDFGHLFDAVDVPVAVEVVAEFIEADAAAGDAIGIAEGVDFPRDGGAEGGGFGGKEVANEAFADPGTAGFPAVLAEEEPGDFGAVADGPEGDGSVVHGLADDFFGEAGAGPFAEGGEVTVRVGRDVGDPEALGFWGDLEAHAGFGGVIYKRFDVCPVAVVPTDDGGRVGGDGAAVGLVVVFAGEADEIDGERLAGGGVINLEGVPVGLTVAVVLIGFAGEVGAPVSWGDAFDFAEAAAFEVPGDFEFSGKGGEGGEEAEGEKAHGTVISQDLTRKTWHRLAIANNLLFACTTITSRIQYTN